MKNFLHNRQVFQVLTSLFCVLVFSNCFAAEKKRIVFCASEWFPFAYLDDKGQAQGLYNDIIKELFEENLDIEVSYEQVPWKRAQYYVETGQADFLITVKTDERLRYAAASEIPILKLYLNVYTYKDHALLDQIQKISSGKDIKDLNLVSVTNIGNAWHEKQIDSYGVTTYYVDNEENAFNVLANKRADITIEPVYAGSYLINKLGLSDKIEPTEAHFGPLDFYIFFSKKSPHLDLMASINQSLKKISTNGRLQSILTKYSEIK